MAPSFAPNAFLGELSTENLAELLRRVPRDAVPAHLLAIANVAGEHGLLTKHYREGPHLTSGISIPPSDRHQIAFQVFTAMGAGTAAARASFSYLLARRGNLVASVA